MQELIEWIEDFHPNKKPWAEVKEKILAKERHQIIDAYNQDLYGGMSGLQKFNDGTDYYNQTYNNESE